VSTLRAAFPFCLALLACGPTRPSSPAANEDAGAGARADASATTGRDAAASGDASSHVTDAIAVTADAREPDSAPTDACGVCDRVWQCDAGLDHWTSIDDSSGLGCADDRTGTTLRCNGQIDNPGEDSYDQGTWSVTSYGMALVFGGINGFPSTEVDCYPGS